MTFIESIPSMTTIAIVLVFFLLLYGTFGIHLFAGLLENRCRLTKEPVNDSWVANPSITYLCGTYKCPQE